MIVLDMDGVLVDFCQGAYAAIGRPDDYSLYVPNRFDFYEDFGLSSDDFWGYIDRLGPDFWEGLEPYPWFHQLTDLCRSYDFIIATTPSRNGISTAGKVKAIQRCFGAKFRDYFITPRKWLLGAPGRVLIDDKEENCSAFEENGGRAILFPQPWNDNRDKTDWRMGYVETLVKELAKPMP